MFLISTFNGIYSFDEKTKALVRHELGGIPLRSVAADVRRVVAVKEDSDTIFEKTELHWSGSRIKSDVIAWSLMILEDYIYVGAEPARVFKKRFGQKRWSLTCALDEQPYGSEFITPWGRPAAVRTMASCSEKIFYVDIHVGSVFRTSDGGFIFEPVDSALERDVHQVATHPLTPDRVYAATFNGFYLSEKNGDGWEVRNAGMKNRYARALAVSPKNPDLLLITASPSDPHGWKEIGGPNFVVYRSENAGESWSEVKRGLPYPSQSVFQTNCLAFSLSRPEYVLLGTSSGDVFLSSDSGKSFTFVTKVAHVTAVCGV